jgi:hypothetical protein
MNFANRSGGCSPGDESHSLMLSGRLKLPDLFEQPVLSRTVRNGGDQRLQPRFFSSEIFFEGVRPRALAHAPS